MNAGILFFVSVTAILINVAAGAEEAAPANPKLALEQADVLEAAGDFAAAESAYRAVITLAEGANDPVSLARAEFALGTLLPQDGRSAQAEENLLRAIELAEAIGNTLLQIDAQLALAKILVPRAAYERAEAAARAALTLAEQTAQAERRATAMLVIGQALMGRRDLAGAEKLFGLAIDLDENNRNAAGLAADYSSLGNLYGLRANDKLAQEMYLRAVAQERLLAGPNADVARAYAVLGLIEGRRNNPSGAEDLLRRSVALYDKTTDRAGGAYAKLFLGNTLSTLGKGQEACAFWRAALIAYQSLHHPWATTAEDWMARGNCQ